MKFCILPLISFLFSFISFATSIEQGVYQVNVQFSGGPIFKDFVTYSNKEISTFTVPGTLTERIDLLISKSNIEFTLISNEGGKPFQFQFKGTITSNKQFEGTITDLSSHNEIGYFKAKKLQGDSCE